MALLQPPPAGPKSVAAEEVKVIEPEPWELGRGHRFNGRVNLALESEQGNSRSRELGVDVELSYRRLYDQLESYGQLEEVQSRLRVVVRCYRCVGVKSAPLALECVPSGQTGRRRRRAYY